jgi:hypothetical protein
MFLKLKNFELIENPKIDSFYEPKKENRKTAKKKNQPHKFM